MRVCSSLRCAAAFIAVILPATVLSQSPSGGPYVTRSGDNLLSMAERLRTPKVTMNQMALALARGNMETFKGRPGLPPPAGTRLMVPDEVVALKVPPQAAEVEVAKIWRSEQHYKAGQALEKSGDIPYAFDTYTYAAELGHGPSQLRLAQLYDRGLSGYKQRDFLESMRWYERARAQKVPFSTQRSRNQYN